MKEDKMTSLEDASFKQDPASFKHSRHLSSTISEWRELKLNG
jgi:hypothetical protein